MKNKEENRNLIKFGSFFQPFAEFHGCGSQA